MLHVFVHLPWKVAPGSKAASRWLGLGPLWRWMCLLWVTAITSTPGWAFHHTRKSFFQKIDAGLPMREIANVCLSVRWWVERMESRGSLFICVSSRLYLLKAAPLTSRWGPRENPPNDSHWKTLQTVFIPSGRDSDAKFIGDDGQTRQISYFVHFLEKLSCSSCWSLAVMTILTRVGRCCWRSFWLCSATSAEASVGGRVCWLTGCERWSRRRERGERATHRGFATHPTAMMKKETKEFMDERSSHVQRKGKLLRIDFRLHNQRTPSGKKTKKTFPSKDFLLVISAESNRVPNQRVI